MPCHTPCPCTTIWTTVWTTLSLLFSVILPKFTLLLSHSLKLSLAVFLFILFFRKKERHTTFSQNRFQDKIGISLSSSTLNRGERTRLYSCLCFHLTSDLSEKSGNDATEKRKEISSNGDLVSSCLQSVSFSRSPQLSKRLLDTNFPFKKRYNLSQGER